MENERTSVTISGETLSKLRAVADIVGRKPHDVALVFIKDSLAACEADYRPTADDLPMIELIRKVSRKNLTAPDRLIIGWLEKAFPAWREKTAEYRQLLVQFTREATDLDIHVIHKLADEAWDAVQAKHKEKAKTKRKEKQSET